MQVWSFEIRTAKAVDAQRYNDFPSQDKILVHFRTLSCKKPFSSDSTSAMHPLHLDAAKGRFVNNPQQNPPGDWRQGGYRDAYERVPRPPRTPSTLARELIYGYQGSQSALRLIGGIFLVLGLPLILFLGDGLITDFTLAVAGKSAMATVTGTRIVTSVEINDVHPIEIKYDYQISGEKFQGMSYTTNNAVLQRATQGESISIEILSSAPSWSRIEGTTSSKMGMSVVFLFLFPLIGGALFGWAVRSNRREIRAFRDGVSIKGLVVKRGPDETTEINGKNPHEVVWEFQVDGTNYKGKLSHMNPVILNRALPDSEVTVLYDPKDPHVNTVWID